MLHGIDIASHQSNLINSNPRWLTDYNDFVVIKATEGVNYYFSEFNKYANMCRATGTPYGLYHYARAEKNTAIAEAMYFLSHCSKNRDAFYALDVEGESLKNDNIDEWCRIWLDTVYRLTGIRPLLYASRAEVHRFKKVQEGNYGLWVADCGTKKVGDISPWKFWAMWQYHVNRELNLDMNMFNGSEEQLRKYCGR
jgi:lysozyme